MDTVNTTMDLQEYWHQLEAVVEDDSARHLELFQLVPRAVDDTFAFFSIQPKLRLDATQFSASSPEVLEVYHQLWSYDRHDGMWLDSFVRGACAVSVILQERHRADLRSFIAMMMEEVERKQYYPAIQDNLIEYAALVNSTVLNNEEYSNRERLLAYNHGVWWALGHVQQVELAYVDGYGPLVDWLTHVLVDRAQRAVMED